MNKIWVDADACPVVVKEILFRAAERTGVELTLIANHFMKTPKLKNVKLVSVEQGFDVADDEIVRRITSGDLVISADIPLAAEVVDKGAKVLTPRGEVLAEHNIKARLTMRDFMESLRSSGVETGGPSAFDQRDRKQFAQELDKWLAKNQ